MNQLQQQKLYTTTEAAHILGVTRITIFRWVKEGILPAIRIGRNYFIQKEEVSKRVGKLSPLHKEIIGRLVERVVADYGETIRMLGKE